MSKKAPAPLPPLPTTGGSYVLSADGKAWLPKPTTDPTALIEAPTDGTLAQPNDLGEGRDDLRDERSPNRD